MSYSLTELNNLSPYSTNLLLYKHLDGILEHSAVHVYLKDKFGKYLAVNTLFEQIIGLKSNEIVGLNDFDFFESSEANYMRKNDDFVLTQEKNIKVFESATTPKGIGLFLNYKTPLRSNKGKTIGLLGFSFFCDEDENLPEKFYNLQVPLELCNINPSTFIQKNATEKRDILTIKQLDCLYYLIKGMTAKQIAKTLGLSNRTVEDHLYRIKEKFNCTTRFDLITQALKITYIKNKLFLDSQTDSL